MNIGILPSVKSTQQKRDAKPGVCSRIIRLTNNQTQRRRKATIHTQEEKATTRTLWLMWELYHNWVASRKTRSHWILKEENSPGETRCKKSWDRFAEYGSPSLRYAKEVKKGPSLGKIQVKHLHQRSPYAMKIEDRSHEETERQQRCEQARHGILLKTYTSSKRKTRLHSTRPQRNGYYRLHQ